VEFGNARAITSGGDISIVGISNMVMEALRAHELLAEIGIAAEVIDPISLIPLDVETIADSVRKTGRLLVVDNAWTNCGASAEIIARVCEILGPERPFQAQRMGFAPTTCPTTPALEDLFYANPATIATAAHRLVHPEKKHWEPPAELCKLAYQAEFKGPF
jgi:pyruvate dehydrogenase E1 component beta subunit